MLKLHILWQCKVHRHYNKSKRTIKEILKKKTKSKTRKRGKFKCDNMRNYLSSHRIVIEHKIIPNENLCNSSTEY